MHAFALGFLRLLEERAAASESIFDKTIVTELVCV
jgi:hypothetical protein